MVLMKIAKNTMYSIYLISIFLSIYIIFIAKPISYCAKEDTYIHDRKFIENAIKIKNEISMSYPGMSHHIFHGSDLGCCHVRRFYYRILGVYKVYRVEVIIFFEFDELKKGGIKFHKQTFLFNSCAQLLSISGEGLKSL